MTTELDDLRAQIAALQAENDSLRHSDVPNEEERPVIRRERSSWWRAVISAICITMAAILVPVSVVGGWTRAQLVDETSFVSTFAPLIDDPGVQTVITDEASAAVIDAIDVESMTNDLFDGLETLDLPPQASSAIDLLRGPAASGVESLIETTIGQVVASAAFSAVWQNALIGAHRSLVAIATDDGTGIVSIDDKGQIGIELGTIIAELKSELADQGFGFASAIPSIDTTIIVAQSDALLAISAIYNLAATIGYWLPFMALFLAAVGIAIARRRSTALMGVGIGIALGAGTLAAIFTGANTIIGLNAGSVGIPARTIETVYFAIIGGMLDTALVLVFLGVVIAFAAWLSGRWAPAARVRAFSASLSSSTRHSLQARGLRTGGFGAWLYAQRVLVRVLIVALTVLALLSARPLTVGEIVFTAFIALLVWLVVTLLARYPDDPAAPDDAIDLAVDTAAESEPVDSAPKSSSTAMATAETEVLPATTTEPHSGGSRGA